MYERMQGAWPSDTRIRLGIDVVDSQWYSAKGCTSFDTNLYIYIWPKMLAIQIPSASLAQLVRAPC